MLNIPNIPRFSFKKHFIDRVFVELRFQKRNIDWDAIKPIFSEELKKFGLTNFQYAQEAKIEFKSDGAVANQTPGIGVTSHKRGVIGHSADAKKTAELHSDRLIICDQAYESFEAFWDFVSKIVNGVQVVIGETRFSWLGLRKINRVNSENEDGNYMGEGVNDLLFAPLRKNFFDGKKIRLGEFAYILEDSGVTCSIRGRAVRDSNPKVFTLILDFDCSQSLSSALDFKDLNSIADKLNRLQFDIFCWVTDPELLKAMGEV